jgi:hypothetical protein
VYQLRSGLGGGRDWQWWPRGRWLGRKWVGYSSWAPDGPGDAAVLQASEAISGPEYLFLDEAQFVRDWDTWVEHQVDFRKDRRIAFTGSAMPLVEVDQESGVGRWHIIRLTRLSFYEPESP